LFESLIFARVELPARARVSLTASSVCFVFFQGLGALAECLRKNASLVSINVAYNDMELETADKFVYSLQVRRHHPHFRPFVD
jgi:hypothetical protein